MEMPTKPHAVVYGQKDCQWCDQAIALLAQHGIRIEYLDVADHKEEFQERFPNANTVPQIVYGGMHIGGHDELVKAIDENVLPTIEDCWQKAQEVPPPPEINTGKRVLPHTFGSRAQRRAQEGKLRRQWRKA